MKHFCASIANTWRLLTTPHYALLALALMGVGLIISAFIIEYVFNAPPCQMCWWQRYLHWGLTAVAILGWLVRYKINPKHTLLGVALFAMAGFVIAVWQIMVQAHIVPLPSSCGSSAAAFAQGTDLLAELKKPMTNPTCDEVNFRVLGLSLAMWNGYLMVVVLGLCFRAIVKKT